MGVPPKLVWRCRRGVKELDILLGRYLEQRYNDAGVQEHVLFDRLLELQDPVLLKYLMGKQSPEDAELCQLVELIRGLAVN